MRRSLFSCGNFTRSDNLIVFECQLCFCTLYMSYIQDMKSLHGGKEFGAGDRVRQDIRNVSELLVMTNTARLLGETQMRHYPRSKYIQTSSILEYQTTQLLFPLNDLLDADLRSFDCRLNHLATLAGRCCLPA